MMNRLSLHTRLLLIAAIAGLAALVFAALAIGHVLQDVVRHSLDEKLDAQIIVLEHALGPDGRLDRAKLILMPGFDGGAPGWGWRVDSPAGAWSGGDPVVDIQMRSGHRPGGHQRHFSIGRPGRAHSPSGLPQFVRQHDVVVGPTTVTITAAGPRHIAERPLRQAVVPLLTSLLLLGLALGLSTWAQLRVGLKPLRKLRDDIARIRTGEADHLSGDQPKELRPLADEVNALIDQNAAGLSHARAHVANMAHGLKTPLTTLALRLEREQASDDSRALVTQLDKRIAHHLRRARTASAGAGERARSALEPVLSDLFLALGQVYLDRGLTFGRQLDDGLMVAVDREDLDELLGNLLDNGCRHARTKIDVRARATGQQVAISIEDDGPGIGQDQLAAALSPGTRLDEAGTGYGFGLAIVRELAELYGGSLQLGRSVALGGLMVSLTLPRPVAQR